MSSASVWYFCKSLIQENENFKYGKPKFNLLGSVIKKIYCEEQKHKNKETNTDFNKLLDHQHTIFNKQIQNCFDKYKIK